MPSSLSGGGEDAFGLILPNVVIFFLDFGPGRVLVTI